MNSNKVLIVLLAVTLIVVVYYLNKDDDSGVIHNDGELPNPSEYGKKSRRLNRALTPDELENRKNDEIQGDMIDTIISQYTFDNGLSAPGLGTFSPIDDSGDRRGRRPSADYGEFTGFPQRKQLSYRKMDRPFDDEDRYDGRDFSYKKKKFTKRTPEDIKDLFDISKMLPNEIEPGWFDAEPLLTTKKIKGTHLLSAGVHMGVNTVGSSLKNATHDIRGEPKNPKINVSVWNNSTIEPDTNLKGICNAT